MMNDQPDDNPTEVDALASGFIDGVVSEAELVHINGDPTTLARAEQFKGNQSSFAAVVSQANFDLDAIVHAGMNEFDQPTALPFPQGRPNRFASRGFQVVAVAAAAVLMFAVIRRSSNGEFKSATTTSLASTSQPEFDAGGGQLKTGDRSQTASQTNADAAPTTSNLPMAATGFDSTTAAASGPPNPLPSPVFLGQFANATDATNAAQAALGPNQSGGIVSSTTAIASSTTLQTTSAAPLSTTTGPSLTSPQCPYGGLYGPSGIVHVFSAIVGQQLVTIFVVLDTSPPVTLVVGAVTCQPVP